MSTKDYRHILVRDFMTSDVKSVSPDEGINVVFNMLNDSHVRQSPVVEDGKLVGIITDRDLRMALQDYTEHPGMTVKNVMINDPVSVKEHDRIIDAANLLIDKKINALPVKNGKDEVSGILTTTDIIRGFISFYHKIF